MYTEIIHQVFYSEKYWTPLILRITLGGVLFPHATQKLFGWFNGPGLSGEMEFMKGTLGLPAFVAIAAITVECLGTFMILTGFGTRIAAVGIFGLFTGMISIVHFKNGYFMNWFGKLPAGREGFEFHLLVLGICIVLVLLGGGKWAVDNILAN
ncbi:DoxX family protein [Sinomicrobium kalidii]|uniref:DoxX family protein n=1 Tax=Sinomicrobium kalidii TaxID=2900738 RepID=UPI001E2B2C67|nr:DoxX family protein [Sinomicrobium kalidii]UGU17227.1 DoxX family protein [Sinomicrobium kalidii]